MAAECREAGDGAIQADVQAGGPYQGADSAGRREEGGAVCGFCGAADRRGGICGAIGAVYEGGGGAFCGAGETAGRAGEVRTGFPYRGRLGEDGAWVPGGEGADPGDGGRICDEGFGG